MVKIPKRDMELIHVLDCEALDCQVEFELTIDIEDGYRGDCREGYDFNVVGCRVHAADSIPGYLIDVEFAGKLCNYFWSVYDKDGIEAANIHQAAQEQAEGEDEAAYERWCRL
jgi:hypothetical protein